LEETSWTAFFLITGHTNRLSDIVDLMLADPASDIAGLAHEMTSVGLFDCWR